MLEAGLTRLFLWKEGRKFHAVHDLQGKCRHETLTGVYLVVMG